MAVQNFEMVYKINNNHHLKTSGKFKNFMCVVYSKLALLLRRLFGELHRASWPDRTTEMTAENTWLLVAHDGLSLKTWQVFLNVYCLWLKHIYDTDKLLKGYSKYWKLFNIGILKVYGEVCSHQEKNVEHSFSFHSLFPPVIFLAFSFM